MKYLASLIKAQAGASPSGASQAGQGAERAGHKYLRREWRNGRWFYDYGDGQGLREAKQDAEPEQEPTPAPDPATERKARAALAQALDHPSLPDGFTIQTPAHTYHRTARGWQDEQGQHIGDGSAMGARLERDAQTKRGGALTLKQALWAFLEGAVPGSDPTWKIRAGIEEDPRAILARNRNEQERADDARSEVRAQARAEQDKAAQERDAQASKAREEAQAARDEARAEQDKARAAQQEARAQEIKAREEARTQSAKEREDARAAKAQEKEEGRAAKAEATAQELRAQLQEAKAALKQREERRVLSRELQGVLDALSAPEPEAPPQSIPSPQPPAPDALDIKHAAAMEEALDRRGLDAFAHQGGLAVPEATPEGTSPTDTAQDNGAAQGGDTPKPATSPAGQVVERLVDDALLQDLTGDKLTALRQRAPKVAQSLKEMLGRLGQQRPAVQARVADLLAAPNWNGSARAEMIGRMLDSSDVRRNASSIMEAAANLAQGGRVEPHHVAAAAAMRGMGASGGEGAWSDSVRQVGQDAERELARVQGLLAQARANPDKAREALSAALSSGALQKIQTLARAFPGMQDRAADAARDVSAQAVALAPREGVTTHGAQAPLFTAGEMGRASQTPARYRIIEAHEAIPSHDPETWAKNGAYPEGIQERQYHSDKAEQHKVERNARNLEPAFVVNTNPDALNGPPIMTPEGHVLGGNSRTMSMQLAYRQGGERARALRQHLEDNAHHFGFRPEDVRALVNPILVREVSPEDRSPEHMRRLVRQYNEGMTQAMDPKALSVALSSKLGDDTIHNLASQMEAGESLAEFLDSPRSRPFVEALDRAGVIDERNANAYKDKGGRLNADGRRLVERALVGKVVGDADLLHRLPESTITGLARAVPSIYQAEGAGQGYNIRAPLKDALDGLATMHARGRQGGVGVPSSDASPEVMQAAISQLKGDMFGADHPATANPRAAKLLEALVRRPGSRQIAGVFSDLAASAQANPEGQASLFGGQDPEAVFHQALDRHLRPSAPEPASAVPEPASAAAPESSQEQTASARTKTSQGQQGAGLSPASTEDTSPAQVEAQAPQTPSSQAPSQEPAPQAEPSGQVGLFGPEPTRQAPPEASEEDAKPEPNPNQTMLFSVPQEPAHPPEEEAVPTLGALWRRALLLKGMARGGAVSNQEATKPESSDSMTAAPHMSDESEPMHAPDDLPTADGLPDDEGGGWRTSSRESSHGGGLWDDDQEPSGAEVDRVLWGAGAQEVGESEL